MISDHPLDKIFGDILARFLDFTHAPVRNYKIWRKSISSLRFLWYRKTARIAGVQSMKSQRRRSHEG
jgi:hypothetical protein